MVSLKLHCEQILIGQVKDPTAFLLLAIADRYSAIKLRVCDKAISSYCEYTYCGLH